MIKKLTFALAIVAGAMVAQADYLWWQVNAEEGRTFSYAELFVSNDGGVTKTRLADTMPVDIDEDTWTGTKVEMNGEGLDVSAYANGSPEYSFFVELINYTDDTWETEASRDRGTPWSYTDLLSQGYITTPGVGLPNAPAPGAGWDAGVGAGGSAVPEPTSGMLFLLGGALMALRRRRRA